MTGCNIYRLALRQCNDSMLGALTECAAKSCRRKESPGSTKKFRGRDSRKFTSRFNTTNLVQTV